VERPIAILLALLAAAGCAETPPAADAPPRQARSEAAAASFASVVVFGDSLVDAGNIHVWTNGRRASAADGYVAGRFTNGYTFADRIALAAEGRVTRPSRSGGANFAYGGAKAIADEDGIPDSAAQIEAFRASLRGPVDPRTLFILTFGGNDLRHAPAPGSGTDAYHRRVARSYADAVRSLFALGARTVLVTGAPVPSDAGAALQRRIDSELDAIDLAGGRRLLRYDFLSFWQRLRADAAGLGFRPFSAGQAAAAAMPGAAPIAGQDCRRERAQARGCPGYVLFDQVHPTAAVHALIARDIADKLGIEVADPPSAGEGR
jgi:outer membrane lipase/esterase